MIKRKKQILNPVQDDMSVGRESSSMIEQTSGDYLSKRAANHQESINS
ncbi:hypothetical protein [Kangiella koreensis]|nr:hypothetical protein [Kangiella koreensis]